jgi:hypothetical protein
MENAKTTKFWNPFFKGCRQKRFAFRHGAFFKLCFYRCPVRRVFSDGHSLVTSLFLQDQLGVGGRILALESEKQGGGKGCQGFQHYFSECFPVLFNAKNPVLADIICRCSLVPSDIMRVARAILATYWRKNNKITYKKKMKPTKMERPRNRPSDFINFHVRCDSRFVETLPLAKCLYHGGVF